MRSTGIEHQIGNAVAHYICELREFLIVTDSATGRYVQIVASDQGDLLVLHCEACSNEFLTEEHSIEDEQEELLRRYGWEEPDPNWWKRTEIRSAGDLRPVVELLTETLSRVFDCADDVDLKVEMGDVCVGVDELKSPAVRRLVTDICRSRSGSESGVGA